MSLWKYLIITHTTRAAILVVLLAIVPVTMMVRIRTLLQQLNPHVEKMALAIIMQQQYTTTTSIAQSASRTSSPPIVKMLRRILVVTLLPYYHP